MIGYMPGTEFHVEWAATEARTKPLSMGPAGYYRDQVTVDSRPGACVGEYAGRIIALGATK